ncbi:unnamed protein product [Enterobius vermicularis]|uniref:Uncharacterized protein n=1 Tax=Enterobius vermicularis TaxID=51028 RepID=A0A158QA51_ENTVE|nr:unnamed protein product [Enterobius vermicularis]
MGEVNDAPLFVYLSFVAFAFIFLFMLFLKLYITFSSRGLCKGNCGRSRTNTEAENTRSRATGIVTHQSMPLPGSYPVYGCESNIRYPYPVINRPSATGPISETIPASLFTSDVPPPVIAHCVTSTSFLPPPPPYSQHDRYPPVEIANSSRIQLTRSFAKVTNDIPPVQ